MQTTLRGSASRKRCEGVGPCSTSGVLSSVLTPSWLLAPLLRSVWASGVPPSVPAEQGWPLWAARGSHPESSEMSSEGSFVYMR